MAIIEKRIILIPEFIQNKKLSIPHFQRPYKWSLENVIQLMEDIDRFKASESYRIGTVVIFREKGEDQIIDGQQRSITFLLLIRALVWHASRFTESLAKRLDIIARSSFEPEFKSEISKHNIQKNFVEIDRRCSLVDEGFVSFFLERCQLTYIVLDDVAEAFQFFDGQNARGKNLDPHDLLKAYHLREMQGSEDIGQADTARIVDTWEAMDSDKLAGLFADFLYRVRGWSRGDSSRYFTKADTKLFKGINLGKVEDYPYIRVYRIVDDHLKTLPDGDGQRFPFQLDQTIINGRHFFEMVSFYKSIYESFSKNSLTLSVEARLIMNTLDSYGGKNRTGDKYVRMLFNCAVLYYLDKFGDLEVSKAIEVIFIWAYSIRLEYKSLSLAALDNYVVRESNIFRRIKESIYAKQVLNMSLPFVCPDHESEKTEGIKQLFKKMKYYGERGD